MSKNLVIITVVALLAVLAPSGADAQVAISGTFSGSLADTMVDLDTTSAGGTASIGAGGGSSNVGAFTWRTFAQVEDLPVANVNCTAPDLEFNLVGWSGVLRLSGSGFLIYLVNNPAADSFFCVDALTGAFSGQLSAAIAGGTGPVSNATGDAEFVFSGATLLADDLGDGRFSVVDGSFSGTIIP